MILIVWFCSFSLTSERILESMMNFTGTSIIVPLPAMTADSIAGEMKWYQACRCFWFRYWQFWFWWDQAIAMEEYTRSSAEGWSGSAARSLERLPSLHSFRSGCFLRSLQASVPGILSWGRISPLSQDRNGNFPCNRQLDHQCCDQPGRIQHPDSGIIVFPGCVSDNLFGSGSRL